MKLSHFTIIIVVTFSILFWITMSVNQENVAVTTSNKDYSMIITNACYDAIKTIDTNKTRVFETKGARKDALDVCYKTILKGLDIDNGLNDEFIKEKTPFVILVDTDGFYLSYNTRFDKAMTVGLTDSISACTGLNTWSEDYSGYKVRFFLNDYIEVITPDNKSIKGNLEEVSAMVPALTFLSNPKAYDEEKRYCVIHCMEDEINYLLNTQSINTGSWRMGYSVSLSEICGEDWSRMLKNPTIISFLQGPNKNNFTQGVNIYGYAASEETRGQLYYAEDGLYYRAEDDIYEDVESDDNGTTIITRQMNENVGNMLNLAQKGNNPDITAYRNQ